MSSLVTLLANIVAPLQRQFINFIRIAICVVMVWIGGLKVCQYEADGIAHFVSNSPFLSFLYKNGANEVTNDKGVLVKEYTLYKNPEGKMVAKISNGIKPTHLYRFLYYWRNHCDNWYFSISGHLVSNIRFIRRLTHVWYVDSHAVLPDIYARNLGAEFRWGLPNT